MMLNQKAVPYWCVLVVLVALSVSHARAETLEAQALTGSNGETLCLDVDGSRAEKGTSLILYRCHGGKNQSFTYFPASGEIRSELGNFCVDVNKGAAAPGTRVQLWECNGSAAQKFDYDVRNQRLTFRSDRTLCLDVRGALASATLARCNDRAPQRFAVTTRYGRSRFDELTFLVAHNAFANYEDSRWSVPNQSRGISHALSDGVRAFMLDIYSFESGTARCVVSFGSDCYGRDVYLCHENCGGVPGIGYALPRQTLAGSLQKIVDFLGQNPEELVTIFLEDYVSQDELRKVLDGVPGLRDLMFDPYAWNVRQNGWPLASSLVMANDRLLIFSDHSDKRDLGVAFGPDLTVENYWSMGGINPDYTCRTRWDNIPLDRTDAGFNRLFVMNHFRDVALPTAANGDNQLDNLTRRAEQYCVPVAKRKPNYVAVDFYEKGDALGFVGEVNDAQAILFQHDQYNGRAQLLGEGSYALGDLFANDAVSSVRVLPGATLMLFEHDNRGGRSKAFRASATYVGDDFNDITSSALVLRDRGVLQHRTLEGDFDGDGRSDRLVYHGTTGDLLLGRSSGLSFSWSVAGNIAGFGNLLDGQHALFAEDFTGDRKTDILFYYAGDGNWWLGRSTGTAFTWGIASNSADYGNLLERQHQLFTGDFNGDGKEDMALYYSGTGNVWFGLSNGASFSWAQVASIAGFGSLLDDEREIYVADFTGDKRTDLAFYYAGNGDFWIGASSGTALSFSRAANLQSMGNLLTPQRRRYVGDYNGDGRSELAVYDSANGDIWLGISSGTSLSFAKAGNVAGFGSLLDASRAVFSGDFDGDGKTDLGFHYAGNGDTWQGISTGTLFNWRRANNTIAYGNLLDPARSLSTGDFDGDGRTDLLSYSSSTGALRIGRSTGSALEWREAGSASAFGDFTR
jgi:hypothetical protein